MVGGPRTFEACGLGVAACAALAVALPPPAARAAAPPPVALVKAEFIERFTRFVTWPKPALPEGASFVLCVVGTTPVLRYLKRIAQGRRIQGRPVLLRTTGGEEAERCHVLFIGASRATHMEDLLARAAGRPVLTIADSPGAAEQGVIVNFYHQGPKLRFEINRGAADRGKLKISAKLLRLARIVRDRGPP